jgi:hypothetical protein
VETDEAGKYKATNVTLVGGSPVKPPPPPPRREPRVRSDEGGTDENGGGGGGGGRGRGGGAGGGRGGGRRFTRGRRTPDKPTGETSATTTELSGDLSNTRGDQPRERKDAFHFIMTAEAKEMVKQKGIELGTKLTIDLALGDARVKLGQGGYCSCCTSSAHVYEGTFTCDENGNVVFTWARALVYSGTAWTPADPSSGIPALSLTRGTRFLCM